MQAWPLATVMPLTQRVPHLSMKRYNVNKDMNKLIAQLVREGWTYVHQGRGHPRVVHPGGRFVVFSLTPSDHRAILNFKRDVERVTQECNQLTTKEMQTC